jgi:hypothetical protein
MTQNRRLLRRIGLITALGAIATGCPGDDEPPLEHGTVRLEFKRAENQASNPYDATVNVEITLNYLECLVDFYDANPDYTQAGTIGLPAFGTSDQGGEGWSDRLCDDDSSEAAPCNVVEIVQELDQSKHLKVLYEITGPLEDHYLRFGPLPLESTASCEGGLSPTVRVASNGAIRGLNGDGTLRWETKSFTPDTVKTNQGQAITVRGGAPD